MQKIQREASSAVRGEVTRALPTAGALTNEAGEDAEGVPVDASDPLSNAELPAEDDDGDS
jgi:hypothetical protein